MLLQSVRILDQDDYPLDNKTGIFLGLRLRLDYVWDWGQGQGLGWG